MAHRSSFLASVTLLLDDRILYIKNNTITLVIAIVNEALSCKTLGAVA